MADSGNRKLNYCPKCKMYFMNTHCPICKEYRPQIEYDERFRDLQGIPEEYREELRNPKKNNSSKQNIYNQPISGKDKILWILGFVSIIAIPVLVGCLCYIVF